MKLEEAGKTGEKIINESTDAQITLFEELKIQKNLMRDQKANRVNRKKKVNEKKARFEIISEKVSIEEK